MFWGLHLPLSLGGREKGVKPLVAPVDRVILSPPVDQSSLQTFVGF
jgi:hypothetical protein